MCTKMQGLIVKCLLFVSDFNQKNEMHWWSSLKLYLVRFLWRYTRQFLSCFIYTDGWQSKFNRQSAGLQMCTTGHILCPVQMLHVSYCIWIIKIKKVTERTVMPHVHYLMSITVYWQLQFCTDHYFAVTSNLHNLSTLHHEMAHFFTVMLLCVF